MQTPTLPDGVLQPNPKAAAVGLARNIVAMPFIYAMIAPLAVLDLAASLYQAICFRLWRIPQVRRGPYVRIDRLKLAYLNGVQKLNCAYCGYANGSLAYAVEIASRTEQFWCPIQHEDAPLSPHRRYHAFIPFGDEQDLHARWQALRAHVQDEQTDTTPKRPD